ncbi:hypothetical protein Holit_01875 [Hollandina sp. SP2]
MTGQACRRAWHQDQMSKLNEPRKNISELVNSGFDKNPPLDLRFEEQEQEEKVFMCGLWEI